MINQMFIQGRALAGPLAVAFANVQAWLDGVLVRSEVGGPSEAPPQSSGFPVWAIVVIGAVVLLCLVPFCIIVILTLLGPAIGNVFSNIIDNT